MAVRQANWNDTKPFHLKKIYIKKYFWLLLLFVKYDVDGHM